MCVIAEEHASADEDEDSEGMRPIERSPSVKIMIQRPQGFSKTVRLSITLTLTLCLRRPAGSPLDILFMPRTLHLRYLD